MEEWKEYRLGEIGEIITGKTPSTKVLSYYDGSIHFVGPADLNNCNKNILSTSKTISELGLNSIRGSILPKGAICVSCIGNLGYVGITTMQCASNQQINSIIVDESKFDRDYIYYTIRLLWRFFKSQENQSTTISILNKTTFSNIKFFAPSLEKQKLISEVLSNFDDKIEVNRRINEQLEELAQALFKSWFVDFEPFKDGEFVESELGMIPEGWKVVSLGELMKYSGGSQPPASEFIEEYKEGYIRFIQIRDYASESHITYIPISKKNKLCDVKDIMIARYGASLGRICYGLKGAYNVALAKVTPLKEYYREFLRCYLSSKEFYEGLNMKGNRAVQAGFNQGDIDSFMLPFPTNENIIMKYEAVSALLFEKRLHNQQEILHLTTLRDTLLPKLMSGEIDVNEVEI